MEVHTNVNQTPGPSARRGPALRRFLGEILFLLSCFASWQEAHHTGETPAKTIDTDCRYPDTRYTDSEAPGCVQIRPLRHSPQTPDRS